MKVTSFLLSLALTITGVWYMGMGCASISSPTGGPKDTIPPQVVSIFPKNGMLNYKEGLIRFEFDEAVALKNLQTQLIITPRTEIPYKTKVSKNVVELEFDDPLNDSTTYTFNFREGVGDITEGNVAKDLYLAFSTGNYLDSLTISGRVEDALTGEPLPAATIALYNARDTATVTRDKPYYFTTASDSGIFEMKNLKRGRYLLYAFKDNNNNLTLQTKSERYGFVADTLELTAKLDSLQITTFSVNAEQPKINGARPAGNHFEITFNKPMMQYELQVAGDTGVYSNFIDDRKKIRIYPFPVQDSVQATLIASDSLQQEIKQELYLKFEESKRANAPFNVQILPAQNSLMTRNVKVTLNFTKPVKSFSTDSVRFQYDSLNWEMISPENLNWNNKRDQLVITKTINPPKPETVVPAQARDAQYLARGGANAGAQQFDLVIPRGRIISVEADTADNQLVTYRIATENTTGLISGNVTTSAENFLVQLVNSENMKVAQQLVNAKRYLFRYVEPGDYLIRIVMDRNANKQWDPGNINTLEAPETVFISEQPITIKANWEIQNHEIIL